MTCEEAIAELRAMSKQLVTAKKPNALERIIHAVEDEHSRLTGIARAAIDFYDVSWQIGGSPLDLAAVFGPDFAPPGPDELEKAAHKLRDALLAAGYGRPYERDREENKALRKEVNALRAKLGIGRKYVEWGDEVHPDGAVKGTSHNPEIYEE